MLSRNLITAVVLTVLGTTVATGQRREGPPDPAQRQAFMLDVMASQMNLTKEQRTQLQSILDSARESAKPYGDELMKTREALRNAIRENKPAGTLEPLHKHLGSLHAKLSVVEAKAFAEILGMLTPEQKVGSDIAFNMLGMLMMPSRPAGDRHFARPPQPQ